MNPFSALAALGYPRTVPVIPPDAEISEHSSLFERIGTRQDGRGKTPGVKRGDGSWSSFNWVPYEADDRDYDRWARMGAGVGLKTGGSVIAIDADTMDEAAAELIRTEVEAAFGLLPVRIGRAPKALYVLRCDEDLPYCRVDFGQRNEHGVPERVEVLTAGRHFVAQGIHPKTLQPYRWTQPLVPFAELPAASADAVLAFLDRLRMVLPAASELHRSGGTGEYDQEALAGDPKLVRKAVEALPNDHRFDTRESYLDVGYAIRAALPDDEPEAFEIFADWCDKWTEGNNDPAVIEADWRRMKPPYRRGAGWLYDQAEQLGGGAFSTAEAWFQPITEDQNPFAQISLNAFQGSGEKRRFDFLDFDEAAVIDPANEAAPLIKGLLDQGAMSVLYGDSNVGKTFVAMDMAFHVATGLPYAGLKVTRGLVVYIAAEGGRGARKRLAALRVKFDGQDHAKPLFKLLASSVDLLRPDADVGPLCEALADIGMPISLVVVDTLSRAMAGGDENSSVDMGAMVKHLDRLRAACGGHVMVVHHTGKDKAKGARGHSLLRAATDTEIEVAEGRISATKQRDLDKSWSGGFELAVHVLGVDGEGDPVTSCTVRLMAGDAAGGAVEAGAEAGAAGLLAGPTPQEQVVLDALGALCAGAFDTGMGKAGAADIEALLAESGSGMSRNVIRFHLRNLERKNEVKRAQRGFWAVFGTNGPKEGPSFAQSEVVEGQTVRREAKDEAKENIFD